MINATVKQAPGLFVLACIGLCTKAVLEALIPALFGAIAAGETTVGEPALLLVLVVLCLPIVMRLRDAAWIRCSSLAIQYTAKEGIAHVLRLDTDWHNNQHSGALTKTISKAVSAIEETGDILFYTFVPVFITTISVCIGLWLSGSSVASHLLIGMLVFTTFCLWHAVVRVAPKYRHAAAVDTNVFGGLTDVLSCHTTVLASGNMDREISDLADKISKFGAILRAAWSPNADNNLYQHIILAAMVIPSAVMSVIYDDRTELIRMISAWLVIRGTATDMATELRRLVQHYASAHQFLEMIATKPIVIDKSDAIDLRVSAGEITIENVWFGYNNREPLFQGLNLTIPAGKTVALVGHSGCGKTTLAKLLLRLYDPTAGRILIDGHDIQTCTADSVRSAYATVFQDIPLFSRSVRDNIAYLAADSSSDQMLAVDQAALTGVMQHLPGGLDCVVGERGIKLSGGERQRVAVARAIYAQRPIVLLDEATSALDTETEKHVHTAITNLMRNKTSIIIAHRLSTVKNADLIVVMDRGKVVETGTHAELSVSGGYYSKLCTTDLI